MPSLDYRHDIDGLRAIAVLAVLGFHLDPELLPGGFQGVDMFFVVSGYVITRLIVSSGAAFSFRDFYRRRFLRLFPALCVTAIATMAAAYPLYAAHDYTTLGWSALASIFGVSNIFFYGHIDYLNDNTAIHPLLHTWSLGVEEQFYLLWPFVIAIVGRRIAPGWLVAIVFGLSFAANLVAVAVDTQFAFYIAPIRFFEFASGAAVLLWGGLVPRVLHVGLGCLGLVLIAIGLLTIGESFAWPDVYALLPVGGIALLLVAGTHPVWQSILRNATLRVVGRLSYTLYLVHWPIIVLYSYWRVVPLSLWEQIMLAVAAFTASALLHALIEVPFREGGRLAWADLVKIEMQQRSTRRHRPLFLGLATLGTISFALTIIATQGLPHRFSDHDRQNGELSYAGDICERSQQSKCQFGDLTSNRIVYIVGDSHAGNLFYGLDRYFRAHRIRGIAFFDHGCLFLEGTTRFIKGKRDDDCAANIADAYRVLSTTTEPVMLAGATYVGHIGPATAPAPLQSSDYWAYVEQQLLLSLSRLNANSRPVMLVKYAYNSGIDTAHCLSLPGGDVVERLQAACKPRDLANNIRDAAAIDGVIERVAAAYTNARTIDPKSAFCDEAACTVIHDGAYLLRDAQHLTNDGSAYLIDRWAHELSGWLGLPINAGDAPQGTRLAP